MRYALKKVESIRLTDIATGELKCILSDIKTVSLSDGQETVYADGANGAHLAAFDNNKTSTLSGENGSIESGYIALSVGSDEKIETNGMEIKIIEELVTSDGTSVLLNHKAHGDAGNEVKFVYSLDTTGSIDKSYTQGAEASESAFKYDAASKTITLPTGKFKAKDTVVVEYCPKFAQYKEILNDANSFSMNAEVRADCWFTDMCSKQDVPLQLYLPAGKVSGNMELSFGDQAAVQSFEIEAMTSGCKGSNKTLWKLYTYDMEDVTDE